jgi:chromosome partitioning protein
MFVAIYCRVRGSPRRGVMTGLVVTIAQRKGGAGKTTLAAQLAVAWAWRGARVAALDIDPQKSLAQWFERRRQRLGPEQVGFELTALSGWRAAHWIEERARSADLVVVDGPPHAEAEARVAVRAAGLVVVPVQPSALDLWATEATLQMARDEGRPLLVVLNRVPARFGGTERIAAALKESGATVAASRIGNRVALLHAMAAGLGVVEQRSGASLAAAEIAALAAEIREGFAP